MGYTGYLRSAAHERHSRRGARAHGPQGCKLHSRGNGMPAARCVVCQGSSPGPHLKASGACDKLSRWLTFTWMAPLSNRRATSSSDCLQQDRE